jgi:SAM-dependent methyltransferase
MHVSGDGHSRVDLSFARRYDDVVPMVSSVASMPAAIEQALALFEPEERPSNVRMHDGYLDLLGEDDFKGPRFAQRALHSRIVPPIYDRVSRPIVLRMLAGMKAPRRREEHDIALRMLELSRGDRVLDVACGPGNFTRDFAAATGEGLVVGLDVARPMLAAAVRKTHSGNVAYIRGDACALPFQGSSFDAICCFGALHLFEDPMQALDQIVRMLAPGGRLALLTTSEDGRKRWRERKRRDEDPEMHKYGGIRIFARDEIPRALGDRGLVSIEQQTIRRVHYISAHNPRADRTPSADGRGAGRTASRPSNVV